jgi:hypothetical protein
VAKKTSKKSTSAPATADVPQTAHQRIAAAFATGNMELVRQVKAELGLAAPVTSRRDALTRVERKPKATKPAKKGAR